MILTVTPNPALDLTYHVDALAIGESHRVDAARSRAGGKGLNVARVLHQTGHATLALAPIGGSTGREFEAELVASGVPHTIVPVTAKTRRSIAIVDDAGGETTILNEQGDALETVEWESVLRWCATLADDADCVVGSGSLPPGAPSDFYARLVRLARDRGLPSIVDATGPALIEAARAGASILKPNRQELVESTGEHDPIAGARLLLTMGAGQVLVSLGAEGMISVTADAAAPVLRARLATALRGNPTGAGDAAVAAAAATLADGGEGHEGRTHGSGAATGLDLGASAMSVLCRATAWSAAAVLMPVAGEISDRHDELQSQLLIDRL